MKPIKLIFFSLLAFLFSTEMASAQTINWQGLKEDQKHIVSARIGWDYSINYAVAYHYRVKSKTPILLGMDFSLPAGDKLFDDFKTKVGGQIRLVKWKNFQISTSIYGIYRRFENPLVRMQNFGSETNAIVGYFQPRWFVAAEVGFDKAIVSHFKHSDLYRELYYSSVKDGWYDTSIGGNFKYGLQTGYSFEQSDITLKLGRVLTQDFKTTPTIPYCVEVGYNFRMPGN